MFATPERKGSAMASPTPFRPSGVPASPVVSTTTLLVCMKWTSGAVAGLICLFALAGCATTERAAVFLWITLPGSRPRFSLRPPARRCRPINGKGADLERRGGYGGRSYRLFECSSLPPSPSADFKDALEMSQKAVAMAERSGNSQHLANALGRLGWSYLLLVPMRRRSQSSSGGARCRRSAREITRSRRAAIAPSGVIFRRLGDKDKSLAESKMAVENLREFLPVARDELARAEWCPGIVGI